ncbi:MAG: CinA family protein [Pseudomonadota bacterium]
MSRAADILRRAQAQGVMIATVESCTGGMVAAALTEVPGASAVVERGFVTYTNRSKIELVGVRADTLDAHGAVSEPVAAEMAQGALAHAPVQLAVSVTGIAGPGGSDVKPEGRVCFGLASPAGTRTETVDFGALGRDKVRQAACDHALQLLQTALQTYGTSS